MIRPVTEDDVPTVARFIRELADYEKLSHICRVDERRLHEHLFGERPCVEAMLAVEDGTPVGFALFFHSYVFRVERWQELAHALRRHGATCPVIRVVESAFGTRYTIEGPLDTPCGRKPVVRTVWILEEGSAAPRLVTAFPA